MKKKSYSVPNTLISKTNLINTVNDIDKAYIFHCKTRKHYTINQINPYVQIENKLFSIGLPIFYIDNIPFFVLGNTKKWFTFLKIISHFFNYDTTEIMKAYYNLYNIKSKFKGVIEK